MIKINPFNPNYPVNPGMFVGRIDEILRLESYLYQTMSSQPANFLITGERGIGKSSLMNYLIWVAKGLISVDEMEFNYLVVSTDINRYTTQLGLMQKIEFGLNKELSKFEPARNFLNECWGFLQRVEVAGTRIHQDQSSNHDETLLDQFSYSLAETIDRICQPDDKGDIVKTKYDGVLILIDEADNSQASLISGLFSSCS